jgi:hypothetical protein
MPGTLQLILTNKTGMDTRLKLMEVMGAPFHLYGCQNWELDRTDKKKNWNPREKTFKDSYYFLLSGETRNFTTRTNYRYLM